MKYLFLFLLFYSCHTAEPTDSQKASEAQGMAVQLPVNTEKEKPVDNTTKQDTIVPEKKQSTTTLKKDLRGIQTKGVFRMYTEIISNIDYGEEKIYQGPPKIEILNAKEEVIKSIDVLKNAHLFAGKKVNYLFKKDLANTYHIQFKNQEDIGQYVDTVNFPNPFDDDQSAYYAGVLLLVEYETENDLLFCKYTYLTLDETVLFGGGSEIVVIDSLGEEKSRVTVDGPLGHLSVSKDQRMLYISTGGDMTEDGFHPTACWIYDLENEKLVYSRKAVGTETVGIGHKGNRGIMKVYKNKNLDKFDFEIMVFDHLNNLVYYSQMPEVCQQAEVRLRTKEAYCYCRLKNSDEIRFNYEKDFQSKPFIKQ